MQDGREKGNTMDKRHEGMKEGNDKTSKNPDENPRRDESSSTSPSPPD